MSKRHNFNFYLMRATPANKFGLSMLNLAGKLQKYKLKDDIIIEEYKIKRKFANSFLTLYVLRPVNVAKKLPVILHFHGGGFAIGAPMQDFNLIGQLIEKHSAIFVIPAYRLSFENPFPAAFDDAYASFQWIILNSNNLQIDKRRVHIMGMSSGGGLATSLAIKLRDDDLYKIASLILIAAMLDDNMKLSNDILESKLSWRANLNKFAWETYLENLKKNNFAINSYAVPAKETDLTNFFPTFGIIGNEDLFIMENQSLFQKLEVAGIENQLEIINLAYHGVETFAPKSAIGAFFRTKIIETYIRGVANHGYN